MQSIIAVLLGLAAFAVAKPGQFVEWFEMKPALNLKPEFSQKPEVMLTVQSYNDEWESFKTTHNKQYENKDEEMTRFSIFTRNLDYILQHNKKYTNNEKSYYLGVNQFADMPVEEFRAYNGLWRDYNRSKEAQCSTFLSSMYLDLPDTVDWRDKGIVTPVKNQGQCGSCWSFSTTGSLEGQNARKTGKLVSFSEQQLVDCSGKFGNQGCNGGLMDQAFEYIEKYGIETESEYPYDAEQERCKYEKSEVEGQCTGCVDVESGSEDSLKKAVGQVGPISIAIDASHQSFQLYKNGVYDEPDCSSTELDHGVLVVGYGTEDGQDYWLVKNSWGTTWGEEGYVKMSRNDDNQCGVATQASYPLV